MSVDRLARLKSNLLGLTRNLLAMESEKLSILKDADLKGLEDHLYRELRAADNIRTLLFQIKRELETPSAEDADHTASPFSFWSQPERDRLRESLSELAKSQDRNRRYVHSFLSFHQTMGQAVTGIESGYGRLGTMRASTPQLSAYREGV